MAVAAIAVLLTLLSFSGKAATLESARLLAHSGRVIEALRELSNRDAIGAKVKLTAGELIQYDHVRAGSSFISGNDLRLHFGLGDHNIADSLEVLWPSGKKDQINRVSSNRILNIRESSGIVGTIDSSKKRPR